MQQIPSASTVSMRQAAIPHVDKINRVAMHGVE
jgi:hypothetical protein